MHLQTHIMSGWCVANYLPLTARERALSMCAASLADLDGLGIVVSKNAYWNYHHLLCHNLPFAVAISTILAVCSTHRFRAGLIYFALAHLHLVMDYFGSGPGWPIHYGWPIFKLDLMNPNAWEFYSWQNISIAFAFFLWVLAIAVTKKRTPLEAIMPDLDRKIVGFLRRAVGRDEKQRADR
jgi:hypothetical protein